MSPSDLVLLYTVCDIIALVCFIVLIYLFILERRDLNAALDEIDRLREKYEPETDKEDVETA